MPIPVKLVLYIVAGLGILVAAATSVLAILDRIVESPNNLGVRDGELAPCPSSPNCVSTQSRDEPHSMEPIPFATSTAEARDKLLRIVRSMERARIVIAEPAYVRASSEPRIWGTWTT